MRGRRCAAAVAAIILLAAGAPAVEPAAESLVILMADGLGVGTLSAVSFLAEADGHRLRLESLPVVGLVRTRAADALVTDSAAGATALATGVRSDRGRVAMGRDGSALHSVLELASAAGFATGVITTSGLVDATPAAFAAHAASRDDWDAILGGMLRSPVDILLGGDWNMAARAEHGGRAAAVLAALADAPAHGVTVVRSADELATVPEGRVLGFFPARSAGGAHGPALEVSTRWSLERLARRGRFVLLVETEETDEGAHANDLERVRAGLEDLDAAVGVALRWQADHPGTLVVVLSDHDTGGLATTGGIKGFVPRFRWATEHHTATWVPLFAGGPGAERLGGVHDNHEIGCLLRALLGLDREVVGAHGPQRSD